MSGYNIPSWPPPKPSSPAENKVNNYLRLRQREVEYAEKLEQEQRHDTKVLLTTDEIIALRTMIKDVDFAGYFGRVDVIRYLNLSERDATRLLQRAEAGGHVLCINGWWAAEALTTRREREMFERSMRRRYVPEEA